ncbi:hypothetical protein GCM10010405_42960 [Streptomyces macrosporus]|uniref:Uncharacterized protein n=1 Tax=Streptomyces macrosporus TaxID=44032 RepID=A0ABN3KB83_9ACTN
MDGGAERGVSRAAPEAPRRRRAPAAGGGAAWSRRRPARSGGLSGTAGAIENGVRFGRNLKLTDYTRDGRPT